jgi:hypothetical protein
MPAGYSGTPLTQKLGLKPATRAAVLGAPREYGGLVSPLPAGVRVVSRLAQQLPRLARALEDTGTRSGLRLVHRLEDRRQS